MIEKEDFTISIIENKKKELLASLEDINVLKVSLVSKQKDLENSFKEISKGFSSCPVCQTQFTEDKLSETKEHVTLELKSIEIKIKEVLEKINSQEKEITILKSKEKTLEKNNLIEKQIEQLNKILIENISLKEITLKDISSLDKIEDLSSVEKEIKELKDDLVLKKEIYKYSSKLKEYQEKTSFLKQELLKINFSQEEYLDFLAEFKNLESSFSQIKESLVNFKNLQETIKKQINNLTVLDKQKQEISVNFKKINNKKQDLSYFIKAIDNSQLQLRKVLIDNINQALTIIWPKVYPYKDYLSARLNADNDYILEVLTLKNDWIRVEGILSGGERACASLSIRIAISLILTKKLGLLILDEPTHNLDIRTIEALSNVLEEELPDLVEQIFIVTHDNKLLETVNSTKFIIERDKENDSVSRITT
jgi:DNA repair exonuclease SbcCD ATPase subunit